MSLNSSQADRNDMPPHHSPYTRSISDSNALPEPIAEIRMEPLQCPWCWEPISLPVDTSVEYQELIEDCSVCCQPILLGIRIDQVTQQLTIRVERDGG